TPKDGSLDDVQLFVATAAATTRRRCRLREGGRARQRRCYVLVVVDLQLVRVAAIDSLAERVHRVLVRDGKDRFAVRVGAARESRTVHTTPTTLWGSCFIPPQALIRSLCGRSGASVDES